MADAARSGVLITRPEPEASATAAQIEAMGLEPVLTPALVVRRLERLAPGDLDGAQGAVFTSAAAVAASASDLAPFGGPPRIAAYCVGAKTAEAARRAGFSPVVAGPGDAAGLLRKVSSLDPAAGALAVLRGRETATPLAARLEEAGFTLRDRALYGADPARALSPSALTALDQGAAIGVLLLSARTTEAFLTLAAAAGRTARLAGLAAICNSQRTAAPARASGAFAQVAVAEHPTLKDTLRTLNATIRPQR